MKWRKGVSLGGIYSNIPFSNITSPDANNSTGTNPKAYLTVLFFDERFNFVEEGSIAQRVSVAGNGAPLLSSSIQVPKNGYAYVYVSNESDEHVYFDNLQINHTRGRITEENHYYAYVLKIAGISSKKLADLNEGQVKNNYGFQGDFSELDDDLGWNDFTLRNYDIQIGRFIQFDPYDQFPSPYTGMGNDPVNNVDPSGGFSAPGAVIGGLAGFIGGGIYALANDKNPVAGALMGAAAGALLGGLVGDINLRSAGQAVGGALKGAAPSIAFNAANQYALYAGNSSPTNDGQVRRDGSRMFSNENDAYKWMFNQSINNNYREVFAVGLKASVLVLPDGSNSQSRSTPENSGYSWKNGNIYDPVSKTALSTLFTMHTHLAPWGDPTPSMEGDGDLPYFAKNTPSKPYLTMGNDGKIYGNYGKWPIGKDGKYHTSDVQTYQIAFDRGGVVRVTNGMVMKKFALREYFQWYMKNVAKIK